MLVVYCCCDKLPQTWWLKTTQMYCLSVLQSEAQRAHWAKMQASGKGEFFLPLLSRLLEATDFA